MEYLCIGDNISFFEPQSLNDSSTIIPRIAVCYLHTLLCLVPAFFIFIFSPLFFYAVYKSSNEPLRCGKLIKLKLVLCSILLALVTSLLFCNLIKWLYFSDQNGSLKPGEAQPLMKLLSLSVLDSSLLLALLLLISCKRFGILTSGVLFIYWFLLAICGLPQFYQEIAFLIGPHSQHGQLKFTETLLFVFYYLAVLSSLVASCFADLPSNPIWREKTCPEDSVSFLNKITFWWFNTMARLGNTRPLTMEDLWELSENNKSAHLVAKFEKNRQKQLEGIRKKKNKNLQKKRVQLKRNREDVEETEFLHLNEDGDGLDPAKASPRFGSAETDSDHPSIIWPIFLTFKWPLLGASLYKLAYDLMQFIPPKLLSLLIEFVQDGKKPMWTGMAIALSMFFLAITQSMFLHQYFHTMFRLGMVIRSVLISAVYKKALVLSNSARKNRTIGEIVNLMSVDVQRLQDMTQFVMLFWSAPLQICLALFFLWRLLGFSIMAGFLCMLAFIPVNAKISLVMRDHQQKQMKLKDDRLKMLNEMLNGIKVLKLYAWEESIEKRILEFRRKELQNLRKISYLTASQALTWSCAPFLVAVVTFATYVMVDPANHILTPHITFVALSLFNILRFPLAIFAMIGSQAIQCAVSNKRLKSFLADEEMSQARPGVGPQAKLADIIVQIKDASFSWDRESPLVLRDVSLSIQKGSLVAIVGRIGSGKSSLLSAMLGELLRHKGTVGVDGRIAYVPQQAWIQNLTMKANVLFGNEFVEGRYERVLEVCALAQDISALPARDQTEIGEKGINLSGGQKQRVSLARAAYTDAEVYLFDDPLSAVDAHVGKHIFDNLIGSDKGFLKDKTRILVTHGLSFLKHCDKIFVIKDGCISESGTYKDLLSASGEFAEVIREFLSDSASIAEENSELKEVLSDLENIDKEGHKKLEHQFSHSSSRSGSAAEAEDHQQQKGMVSVRQKTTQSQNSPSPVGTQKQQQNGEIGQQQQKANIIEKEQVLTGKVKFSVYMNYLKAIGIRICVIFFVICIWSSILGILCNLWLAFWSDNAEKIQQGDTLSPETITRLSVYTALGIGQALTIAIGSIVISFGMVYAGRLLHQRMLKSILRSPMSFFDTTPLGRIINRFGKEVDGVDTAIPRSLVSFIRTALSSVEIIVMIIYATPYFAIVVIPLAIIYGYVLRYYVSTSRQLKRLESTARSPIYSHFQESVQGASSIRAYAHMDRFVTESQQRVDTNNVAYYPAFVANRWLAVRLELVGNLIVFFAALFVVLFRNTDHITAGLAGLAISYALSITQTLNWAVRMTSELETNIVSVERIIEYTGENQPTEAQLYSPEGIQLNKKWPENGKIMIDNLSIRYRPQLELVLRNITAEIHPMEKIGIIGRTGAGKSSLTYALFRLVEPSEGRIIIDDLDISQLGLYHLRSRLTIVPQDPVLFSGTLLFNLDPFGCYKNDAIWNSLRLTHLADFVSTLPDKLDYKISEGGENLSVGQRQLICLARALLRQSKVLVLDEAAASVDIETDHLIQKTIREQFRHCTVLTIAHRLHSVLDSDRLLVLSEGKVMEFDSPSNLFARPNSLFHSLAIDAGITSVGVDTRE